MKGRLLKYWDGLRSSFWFLPSIMTGGAAVLAFAVVAVDRARTDDSLEALGRWAYTGGAEGASSILGTIAGSMVTITGVVFSMTLVALSLASSQLGPRLLSNFMRDTTNQVVVGAFVATFVYALLVLRTIRRPDEGAFVPHLAVTLGGLLAIASVGLLIYFIHHISRSMQADVIVARVGGELIDRIDQLFPEQLGRGATQIAGGRSRAALPEDFDRQATAVLAGGDGYLQSIDADALLKLATDEDVVLRVQRAPGRYVVADLPLVFVWPGERMNERLAERVRSAFVLGGARVPGQDIEFVVNQLVEIALRALSPSLNDPFTAIRCVDRMGSALARLAQRDMPSPYRYDSEHRLRVVAPAVTFPAMLDAAFSQIRQNARSSAAVTIHLLDTIAVIAEFASRAEDRTALRDHTDRIIRGAREALSEEADRRVVEDRYVAANRRLSVRAADGVEAE